MVKWIICVCIAGYFAWACIKKYKDIKRGRFCDCGCSECSRVCGNTACPVSDEGDDTPAGKKSRKQPRC